jgi:16S rRNA (cytosine967-C5)-methyltransferase
VEKSSHVGTGRAARSSGRGTGLPGRAESPRALALRVIRRVTEERAYSNLALSAELADSKLPARDRQLAAELAYGTLRRLLLLDRRIAQASSRPISKIDPAALALLRLGAYQIVFTRIPAHAAVSETVELAEPRSRGFVNAVLRAIARGSASPAEGEDDEAISDRTGLAPWAVAELRRVLPADEVEPAAAALATPADLSLRANLCRTQPKRLEAAIRDAGIDVWKGSLHPDVLHVQNTPPALLPGYEQGWFAVQDEASAVVAAAIEAKPGDRVYDPCGGPGGKAAHLACLVLPRGLVVSADARFGRARLIQRTAGRLGAPVRVLAQDARRPAVRPSFDAALVDAPCSGLGTARRRPELLWRPSRRDLARLARLQVAILVATADLVRPGGRLVYSVCTYPRAETDAAVRAFLSNRPDFEPVKIPGPDGLAADHRLWPHRHGTDAMFYAGFRRLDVPGVQFRPGIESAP